MVIVCGHYGLWPSLPNPNISASVRNTWKSRGIRRGLECGHRVKISAEMVRRGIEAPRSITMSLVETDSCVYHSIAADSYRIVVKRFVQVVNYYYSQVIRKSWHRKLIRSCYLIVAVVC